MRFTDTQYRKAIEDLELGRKQLGPDGHPCEICSDSGHMAWECGFNPLAAMALCRAAVESAVPLHNSVHLAESDFGDEGRPWPKELLDNVHLFLHWIVGRHMAISGEMAGPSRIVMPHPESGDHPMPGGQ